MRCADGFAKLFETGQYGRLYIVSGYPARGTTFRVFVLPPGERALPSGPLEAPLNRDAVEVHEIADESPGRAGTCSEAPSPNWRQDFAGLVEACCAAMDERRRHPVA